MKATEKQIDFAEAIAEELGLDYPDFESREATGEFINDNIREFYKSRNSFRYSQEDAFSLNHSFVCDDDFNGDLRINPWTICPIIPEACSPNLAAQYSY